MNKSIFVVFVLVLLSGCESLESMNQQAELVALQATPNALCATAQDNQQLGEFCDFKSWAQFLIDNAEIKWPQRKQIIDTLSESPDDKLKEILLSQGADTPYRYRLRAQNTITKLQTSLSPDLADALEILIFRPSQQHLEFESAMTILTRINSQQEYENQLLKQQLEELQLALEKEREQLQKLLDIEANMVEQDTGDN